MEPLANGFLSGKYQRGSRGRRLEQARPRRRPDEDQYVVIDAVAAVAAELDTTSAAVALAWLRTRPGTVVPIIGARRLDHLEDNLAGLDVTLTADQLARLDAVSAPTPSYPATLHGAVRTMLQFAGATVDGETSTVYEPLLLSDVRY